MFGGTKSSLRAFTALSDLASVPEPATGIETTATVARLVDVREDRLEHDVCRERTPTELSDCLLDLCRAHVGCLDHHSGRIRTPGERRLHLVVGLHRRQGLRIGLSARSDRLQLQGDEAQGDEKASCEQDRRNRMAKDRAKESTSRKPAFTVLGPHALQDRDVELLHPVAEPREHGRQDRQRSEHRHRHDEDGGRAESLERRVAGQEHPGHRDHDGQPGHEHGTPGGCRRGLEGLFFALAGGALLTLALEIEHRVVDADGKPDQEDGRTDALVHRQDLAEDRDQSQCCDHGSQPEKKRNPRCHERSERKEQDPEGDRKRKLARFLEVIFEHAAELVLGVTCLAELLDHEIGVRRLSCSSQVEYRLNAILGRLGVAGHLEIDQHGVAVLSRPGRSPLAGT